MTINRLNHPDAGLEDWRRDFLNLYELKNSSRKPEMIWLKVVEDASQVGEAVRTNRDKYALNRLAHALCWVLSFVSKLNDPANEPDERRLSYPDDIKSLNDVIWHKYPGVCPRCREAVCNCRHERTEKRIRSERKTRQSPYDLLAAYWGKREEQPHSLNDWMAMLSRIYRRPNARQSATEVAFHYLEEIGEVARALRQIRDYKSEDTQTDTLHGTAHAKPLSILRAELYDEVADTISWTFTLTSKIDVDLQPASLLWEHYSAKGRGKDGIWCPRCKVNACQCDEPATGPIRVPGLRVTQ